MVDYDKRLKDAIAHPHDEWIYQHLQTIHDLTVALNAKSVIELGVQTGQSNAAFLAALNKTGGKLWSCDIDPIHPNLYEIRDSCPFWKFTQGNDTDLSEKAPDADIIFIDTNHEYKHTLRELELYSNCLNPGGIFILHDTYNLDCLGVFGAIFQFCTELRELHFYNYHYCSGLGIVGLDFSKIQHLFNDRGYQWL